MNHDDLIQRLATVTDEEASRVVSPQARAKLAEQIMAAAPEESTGRRLRTVLGVMPLTIGIATAAATVAALLTMAIDQPRTGKEGTPDVHLAALSSSTQGKYLIIKINDPDASPERYEKELAAHGVKGLHMSTLPVQSTMTGRLAVISESNGFQNGFQLTTAKCSSGVGICPVSLKVPINYHGDATLYFGRPARPGEQYAIFESPFAPGEELHCVDIRGRTVSQALDLLRRHSVSVAEYHHDVRGADGTTRSVVGNVPSTWYVSGAVPVSPGRVQLDVQSTKPGHDQNETEYRQMFSGCPR